jgi:hypothetical protein
VQRDATIAIDTVKVMVRLLNHVVNFKHVRAKSVILAETHSKEVMKFTRIQP